LRITISFIRPSQRGQLTTPTASVFCKNSPHDRLHFRPDPFFRSFPSPCCSLVGTGRQDAVMAPPVHPRRSGRQD
jgi:hypothetical protein